MSAPKHSRHDPAFLWKKNLAHKARRTVGTDGSPFLPVKNYIDIEDLMDGGTPASDGAQHRIGPNVQVYVHML
jgi:hypothetical protein